MAHAHRLKPVPSSLLIAASALAFTAPAPVWSQQTVLELVPAQSSVRFTLDAALHTVHGSFHLRRGRFRFNPATGEASGEIVVDATSGASGNNGRDRRMHQNVLESRRYPEIVFVPDRVEGSVAAQGASTVRVHGLFRIHGTAHEVTLPVEALVTPDRVTATTNFTVPYVEWGMKNPSSFLLRVSDKVALEIRIVARTAR